MASSRTNGLAGAMSIIDLPKLVMFGRHVALNFVIWSVLLFARINKAIN